LISGLGGVLGIVILFPVVGGVGAALRAWFPTFPVDPHTYPLAAGITVLVGMLAAVFPAWRAMSVSIANGLRRVG